MKKPLLLLLLAILLSAPAVAQQDPQFSLYMFNRVAINPAFAGFRGATNVTALGRTQWVGIDGHPNTFTLSADAPVEMLHGGLGASLMADAIGPISTTQLKLSYAYRFNLNWDKTSALQIGIAPGFFHKGIDNTRLMPETQNDPVLNDLIRERMSKSSFDLGAGAYLTVEDGRFWAGVHADHLTEPSIAEGRLSDNHLSRMYGVMVGGRIGRRSAPVFAEPSAYLYMAGSQMQLNANVNVWVEPMMFGLSYRGLSNVSDMSAIVGFRATPNLFLAYAYDYNLSALSAATSGSHEIVLSYTFPRLVKFLPVDLDTMDNPTVR